MKNINGANYGNDDVWHYGLECCGVHYVWTTNSENQLCKLIYPGFESYQLSITLYLRLLRQLLVCLKDKVDKQKVVGPVYHIQCDDCEALHVGDRQGPWELTSRKTGLARWSEVSHHVSIDKQEHSVSLDNINILKVENKRSEGVKEAIHIGVAAPSLNNDGGCYLLPPVWTNLLRARVQAVQSQDRQ